MSDLAARLALTAGTLALFGIGAAGMWWGWRRRAHQQGDLLPLPTPPEHLGELLLPAAYGMYVGTTQGGDWQARVVAGQLSDRSAATLELGDDGVLVHRVGAPTLFIPVDALRDARLDSALAGKVMGPGGLLVLTWEYRGQVLDTAFRADQHAVHAPYVHTLQELLQVSHPAAAVVPPVDQPDEPEAATARSEQ